MNLKMNLVWPIARQLYGIVFRPMLENAISDPDTDWDDWVLRICDNIFEYQE